MPVTLQSFVERADATQGLSKLDVRDNQVEAKGTNFLSRIFRDMTGKADDNRATINSFISAIRAEHGDHVADFAEKSNILAPALRAGKPLTSAMVRHILPYLDAERSNVARFNEDTVAAFKAGKDANGLEALVRQMAGDRDMDWLANRKNAVETLATMVRITAPPPPAAPLTREALLATARPAVTKLLDAAKTTHAGNVEAYRQFKEKEAGLLKSLLDKPLKKALNIDGAETKITLGTHFSEKELSALIDASRKFIHEKVLSFERSVNRQQLEKAYSDAITGFGVGLPPNPILVGGMENYMLEQGLGDKLGRSEELQSLAVLYGMHTTYGLETGLTLAKEFSEKLAELAEIKDPATLLNFLHDISSRAYTTDQSGDSIINVLSFALKAALILADADQEVSRKIYDSLTGPVAQVLGGAISKGLEDDSKKYNTLALQRSMVAFSALVDALSEVSVRPEDRSTYATTSFTLCPSVAFSTLPNTLLAALHTLGAPCGFEDGEHGLNVQVFSRMDQDTAGLIIKTFQGQKVNNAMVDLAFHHIQEHGKEGLTLATLYQGLTGEPLSEQDIRNGAFMSDFQDKAMKKAARAQ
jgi:hypothetical protein